MVLILSILLLASSLRNSDAVMMVMAFTSSTTSTESRTTRFLSTVSARRERRGDVEKRVTREKLNSFGDFEQDDDYDDYRDDNNYEEDVRVFNSYYDINYENNMQYSDDGKFDTSSKSPQRGTEKMNRDTRTIDSSSTFYSRKQISDPIFSILNNNNNNDSSQDLLPFQQLCHAAHIHTPSRIQSLAWPPILRGENCIVADQTGSGKTYAYLLPLIQRMQYFSHTREKRRKNGSPRVVILTPTAELADQIQSVCIKIRKQLQSRRAESFPSIDFKSFVITASGSQHAIKRSSSGSGINNESNNSIRDQIRWLQTNPVDILIATPGRLSTILRTKNSGGVYLGNVAAIVLDEVDFLLVDETFGPQLRTVGAAVMQQGASSSISSNNNAIERSVDDDYQDNSNGVHDNDHVIAHHSNTPIGGGGSGGSGTQFIFVTATLPTDVLDVIRKDFPRITEVRGPGLHRIAPAMTQSLVDVSVPSDTNRNLDACMDLKVRELFKALRARRVRKTLIFCNTIETCRHVENVLKRNDRRGKRSKVWAYHNALSPDVRMKNLHSFSSLTKSKISKNDNAFGNGGIHRIRESDSNKEVEENKFDRDQEDESILVCTDRAARGIDFDTAPVDHVILFDFPRDPAEYVRRVGRTARAGRTGASTVLAYGWQLPIVRKIMGLSGGGGGNSNSSSRGGSDDVYEYGQSLNGNPAKANGKNAKLESFTMMKSDSGWDDDVYEVVQGVRKRKR